MITVKKLNIDDGIYQESASKGVAVETFLEDLYAKEAGEESPYAGLTPLEVFLKKKAFLAKGEEPPMTAFEKQLMALDIKAYGMNADPVSKFFATQQGTALFPVFVANQVFAGLLLSSLVSDFAASTTTIKGTIYQKIYLEDTEPDRQLREVAEGDDFPETKIVVSDQTIRVKKFGRYISASYEALANQKLDVFALMLQRIGVQIGIDDTDDMIQTLINGDGNSNTPGTTYKTATAGTITVGDVIGWATALPAPYKLDKFVGKKALLREYYETLAGMNNPSDQFGFIGIQLPKSYEWDRDAYGSGVNDLFVGVDSRYAFQLVTTGAVMTEYEKLIRKQLQGAAISYRSGKNILDRNAVALFDETWV